MEWIKCHRPLHKLNEDDGLYFFGYYDIPAMRGETHLAHRVPFMDRLHAKGDVAELGTIPLSGGKFTPFDETRAWCFQQGSMLQYLPDGRVIYNIENGSAYGARVRCLETGLVRDYPMPTATVARDGSFYLSINFARLYHFRPGYGYAGLADPFEDVKIPAEDGIWRVDMESGACRMLCSIKTLAAMAPGYFTEGEKLCVNHLTISPDGRRAIALVRNMEKMPWRTLTFTIDCQTGEAYMLHNQTVMSHYWWEDGQHILAYCLENEKRDMYRLTDLTQKADSIAPDLFREDGHMVRRGSAISYDSYPNKEGYKFLGLYDIEKACGYEIARVLGPHPACVDIRCDLHPRWHPEKPIITFDSIHEGKRGIYLIDAQLPSAE